MPYFLRRRHSVAWVDAEDRAASCSDDVEARTRDMHFLEFLDGDGSPAWARVSSGAARRQEFRPDPFAALG